MKSIRPLVLFYYPLRGLSPQYSSLEGLSRAAVPAKQMRAGSPNIRDIVLVGVAGGVSLYLTTNAALEIVLGDMVSSPWGIYCKVLYQHTHCLLGFTSDLSARLRPCLFALLPLCPPVFTLFCKLAFCSRCFPALILVAAYCGATDCAYRQGNNIAIDGSVP